MKVLKNNNPIHFDVDGTLVDMVTETVYLKKQLENGILYFYGDAAHRLIPIEPHINFLKHCKNRGDYVVVWSQNGYKHAENVVKLLDLEKYVDVVMSKPTRHVDDKEDIASIVGNRIFIKE